MLDESHKLDEQLRATAVMEQERRIAETIEVDRATGELRELREELREVKQEVQEARAELERERRKVVVLVVVLLLSWGVYFVEEWGLV